MARQNLIEWVNRTIGDPLVSGGYSLSVMSPEAVLIRDGEGGEVVVLSEAGDGALTAGRLEIRVTEDPAAASWNTAFQVVGYAIEPPRLMNIVSFAAEHHRLRVIEQQNTQHLLRKDSVLRELIEIGKRLSAFRDIDALLDVILEKSRFLMGADAGSIYLLEGEEYLGETPMLRFKLSQNDSISYESSEFVIPVSMTSIAGAAAVTRRSILIDDVSRIPETAPYEFDRTFDERTGYRTISVVAVPIINQDGEIKGVVQLLNKKRNPQKKLVTASDFENEVISMDDEGRQLVETLASQAGIAMENARLYAEIERIFNGFVAASVHAIEQRDPTTSGHSFRVAALTRRLSEVVNAQSEGRFRDVVYDERAITEIETAALLHDFGKVGVREEVLVKAKKLYPENLEVIQARLNYIRSSIENDHLQRRMLMLEEGAPSDELTILDEAKKRSVSEIDDCWRVINTANEPTVLEEGDFEKVKRVAARTFFDLNGKRKHYLTDDELEALQVAKGSLTTEELEEIRSHAAHTISFLERIPWGRSLRQVPRYAGCHHEKLDGSGYPNQLTAEDIPLPSRMMAIADIYDALTAADRPYKKAVPREKALTILDYEVKDGHLDSDLVDLFRQHQVYRVLDTMALSTDDPQ